MDRTELWHAGEDAVVEVYRRRGYEIVARNWRSPTGEIDLVARKGATLVFCEVKARRSARWGQPSEAVHARKRGRLRRLAGEWLRANRAGPVDVRFDVASVIVRDGHTDVALIPDAF